jgi:hypothetical protein
MKIMPADKRNPCKQSVSSRLGTHRLARSLWASAKLLTNVNLQIQNVAYGMKISHTEHTHTRRTKNCAPLQIFTASPNMSSLKESLAGVSTA